MAKKGSNKGIEKAMKNQDKGALHRELGIPQGQLIPKATLEAAAKKGGLEGERARFALTEEGFNHKRKKPGEK